MIPVETIDKLELCYRSISEFCAGLSETDWKTPTQLPGWTVQDNLSHMASWEGEMSGRPLTEHRATDLSNVKNQVGEDNEHEVDMRRTWPGSKVLAEWQDVAAERVRILRSADDAYFAAISDGPTGPAPLSDYLQIRVLDLWTHEQDMRRALGRPGHQSGPAAEHTIDRLIRTVPIVIGKRAATPEGQSVVIEITGAVVRTVAVTITEGRGQISNTAPADAVCTITMDSDVFLQLATGRGDANELAAQCSVSGDAAHAMKVLTQFTMMI